MLSMRSVYALKALGVLARVGEKESFLIAELAEAEKIPKKFLEAILLSLKIKGILTSKKGPKGGYALAKPANLLTIRSIVEALEGDLSPVQCLSDAQQTCPDCSGDATCGIKLVMADVKDAVYSILETVTLKDMLDRSDLERQKLSKVLDFSI